MPRNASSPLQSLGRFHDPGLLILAALSAGAKHGYAIIVDVEAHSGRRLGPGTLYGAMTRLEKMKFIEATVLGERGRRPYRITPEGRRAFRTRLAELEQYQSMLHGLATR